MSGLRPFFSYYGSKWSLARRGAYPPPAHDTIVEPFAGSAGYSLLYHEREVVLREIDPLLVGLWRYLIGVSGEQIAALPTEPEEAVAVLEGPPRDLVGFWLGRGRAAPARSATPWMKSGRWPSSFWGERVRDRLAAQVEHIRHWKIEQGTYETAGDILATWFIDPPYQGRPGRHYRFKGSAWIDYAELAGWCRRRRGLAIVCESDQAAWLPFRTLGSVKSIRRTWSHEAAWVRNGHPNVNPDGG